MFENEAFLATRFHHKNVIETYDLYSDRELCVLAMEFLNGQTLSRIRQRARRGGQVPFAIHLRVLAEALAGLHYVHELTDEEGNALGIVHRDITPSNLFVTYDGRIKVVDFGIAQATLRPTETRKGVAKGKLGYMSPEAVRSEGVDRRSDIFSVGVMLWEAATGRSLWQDHDEVAVFRRLATGDLPIQVPGAEGTSADMLRIAERALAVDPRQRYATAEEMRRELEVVLARLGKITPEPALAGYMEALFSVEREKLQAVIDEAFARLPSQAIAQSRLFRSEVSASFPGVSSTEPPPTNSSTTTNGGSLRATTRSYDVVKNASMIRNFRPGVRRAFGVAFVAAAAAMGVAYAAHAPIGAPVPAAGTPVSVEPTAIQEEAPSRLNRPAPEPPLAIEAPLTTLGSVPASPTPARGTIAAVFLVRPAQARLFLDGVPLEGNPAGIRRQPDDKPHLLRVEAPGYATLVRVVDLDHDVAKELELAPDATHAAPRAASSTEPRPAKRAVRDDPWGI
jgi:serine/threonine-protein kinase